MKSTAPVINLTSGLITENLLIETGHKKSNLFCTIHEIDRSIKLTTDCSWRDKNGFIRIYTKPLRHNYSNISFHEVYGVNASVSESYEPNLPMKLFAFLD